MAEMAAGDGLDMRADLVKGANTFDAHRLVQLAKANGVQDAMKERLMRAYHTEGEALGDRETLARLALEVGLPEDEVRDVLAGDRYAAEVREDERTAMALGINAVPFFVVDRRFGAAGAHPPEALGELLRRGAED
jgi:predicted DsbA family dithiol-disulfide isomerase